MKRAPHQPVVRVKICGVTCREDAEAAIVSGADALGFNMFPGSKRFIPPEENLGWLRDLPPFISRVAVLVNAPLEQALSLARQPGVDALQLHGHEDEQYCAELGRAGVSFIKVLRLRPGTEIPDAHRFSTMHILIDVDVAGAFGGTGERIDFGAAAEFVKRHPGFYVIVAGGLTPVNVHEAVHSVRPFGVDVASGVEAEPRRKDPVLMRAFVAAAKQDC